MYFFFLTKNVDLTEVFNCKFDCYWFMNVFFLIFCFQSHNTLDDFKEHISTKVLPKEYGGEVPLKDMIGKIEIKIFSLEFASWDGI